MHAVLHQYQERDDTGDDGAGTASGGRHVWDVEDLYRAGWRGGAVTQDGWVPLG